MQKSEPPVQPLDAALLALPHHRLHLSSTHTFRDRTEVTGFWPAGRDTDPAYPEWRGRAALKFEGGSFLLQLDPTVNELRALAALCTAMADEREAIASRVPTALQAA